MLRRCRGWDYRGRGIYMVTLTLRDRSQPLLGRLVTENDGGGDPEKVLDRMFAYVRDNPRRLAVKRLHPDLFRVRRPLDLPGWPGLEALGNPFLLDRPNLLQVQCSRRISPETLAERKEELLAAARHGAVLVSPCISPGEKEIAAAAFVEGLPLVTILENGFPPFYKPSGKRFDACAAGRLLLLAPWPHHTETRPITRAQCLALNRLSEEVCLRAGRLRAEARSTGPNSPLEP